jgi:hypothetical protein
MNQQVNPEVVAGLRHRASKLASLADLPHDSRRSPKV